MTARFIVADVFDGLASLPDDSVDVCITSPPFLALRSYLPADHPDKHKEIGSEATPVEYIDVMLAVTAELRRVLAPHGSICIELGDTYAGSGGGGGDYYEGGLREGQPGFTGSSEASREALKEANAAHWRQKNQHKVNRAVEREGVRSDGKKVGASKSTIEGTIMRNEGGAGWPQAKSRTLIPQLYEIALAYGINPLTGTPSPAGQWRIRNVVTWARPNPPVGALGDKWRPATSDLIVACTSAKRYWDDLATRKPFLHAEQNQRNLDRGGPTNGLKGPNLDRGDLGAGNFGSTTAGAPLLDYWEIPPGGYKGSHYAVFPEELVVPCVKAMCPERVCRTCGEPSRRIVESHYEGAPTPGGGLKNGLSRTGAGVDRPYSVYPVGWSDCSHNTWRPGLVLDPFAGSGTTLAVATGHGHDAIGIDLDARNAELARERIGPFLFEEATV